MNRKPYTDSPMTLSYLTLSDLESSKLRWWKWSKIWCMHGEVLCESWLKISVVLICSSVCRKWPFDIPTAVVKRSAKVHGPLVCFDTFQQLLITMIKAIGSFNTELMFCIFRVMANADPEYRGDQVSRIPWFNCVECFHQDFSNIAWDPIRA